MYNERIANGAPRIVMPPPGGPIPRTGGMVSDDTAREVNVFRMVATIQRFYNENEGR